MTTLAINAIQAGKELKDYIKTGTEKNPNAGRQDAAAVLETSNTAVPGTAVKPPLNKEGSLRVAERNSVEDQALSLMGGVEDAVTKGLKEKGIKIDGMTGDIEINGVKKGCKGKKRNSS